jgi:carbonic anhydrase/acetyltransferase-like protein (isoleucine patch superfamily)
MEPAGAPEGPRGVIRAWRGALPAVDPTVFVAPGAEIIGNVSIGRDSSVWFNSVVRGDINSITIGERTNIQDGCILHVAHERYALSVGSDVTVGHGVILHACTIGDACLVGMGAIVLDGAVVGKHSLVAAGSLVKMHDVVPEGVLVAGSPARVVRPLTREEIATIRETALNYIDYARSYNAG